MPLRSLFAASSPALLMTAFALALSSSACTFSGDPYEEADAEDVSSDELGVNASSTPLGGHPVHAHFTNPPAFGGNDPTILDEAIRLIDDTPKGATIRAAIHSLTVNGVGEALIAAKKRGVTVRVAEDGSDELDADETPRKLAAALGANHVFCGAGKTNGNHGCVTSDPSGIMHTKLFTFSKTKDPKGVMREEVAWFGSANMTHATGAKTFNNTITVYGDHALYQNLNTYFGHLFNQKHYSGNDYYDADEKRGFFVTDTARIYLSPNEDGDLVKSRLNDIDADKSCRVRVAQSMIHDARIELVDLLVSLKKGGCKVWVVGNDIEPKSLARLKGAGISVHENKVHDKTIIVDAKFAGSSKNRYLVFTGSHNWTYSANYRNDELFVRLESKALYDAFYAHWSDAYNTGDPR